MQSPNRIYVPELDQIRAFAATLVLYYHSVWTGRAISGFPRWPRANIFDALLIEGHTGVALFMVVSGFVLARGALSAGVDYYSFIYNRILRIFPMMTLVMLFAAYANKGVDLQGIISPFLFLFNTQPRFFTDATDLSGTIWTISVEFQFYLIAPFVFSFVRQEGWRYLVGAAILVFLLKCLALYPHRGDGEQMYIITYYTIVGRLVQFLAGVAVASCWPWITAVLSSRRILGLGVLAAGVAAAIFMSIQIVRGGGITVWHPWMIIHSEVEAAIWVVVLIGYVTGRPLADWPRIAALVTRVGVVSYSIYLLHWSIERDFWSLIASHGWGPQRPTLLVLAGYATVIFGITLATAFLSYGVVERPFLMLRKRYVTDPPRETASHVPPAIVSRHPSPSIESA